MAGNHSWELRDWWTSCTLCLCLWMPLKCREKGSCALRHGCSPKPRPFPFLSLILGNISAPLQQHLLHLRTGLYKQRVLQVSAFD